MSNFKFSVKIFFMLISSFYLVGCINQQSNAEKIYNTLENVVEVERQFEEQQEPIVKLEKEEKELYNIIIDLGMKQHDEVVKLAEKALEMVGKREDHLNKEIESIKKSKEEFQKVKELKDNVKEAEPRKAADDLYNIMMNRYQVYDQLSKEYKIALNNDKDLYEMLKNPNVSYEDLEEKVTLLNATYQKVLRLNNEFNQITTQYNKKKLEFYKKSGLKIDQRNKE